MDWKAENNKNLFHCLQIDFDLSFVKGAGVATVQPKEAKPCEEPHKIECPNQDHAPSIVPAQTLSNDRLQPDSCQIMTKDAPRDNVFVLPDLNMMASEDDSPSETRYGMS